MNAEERRQKRADRREKLLAESRIRQRKKKLLAEREEAIERERISCKQRKKKLLAEKKEANERERISYQQRKKKLPKVPKVPKLDGIERAALCAEAREVATDQEHFIELCYNINAFGRLTL